jgi:hypothetical protein
MANAGVTFLGPFITLMWHYKNDTKWPKAAEWLLSFVRRNPDVAPGGNGNSI